MTLNKLNKYVKDVFGKEEIFLFSIFLILLRFIFPGDTSFLHDEAMLIDRALNALGDGGVVDLGLKGTRGFRYGPFGPNFYLVLLLFTKNIYILLFLKTLLVTLLNLFGISLIMKRVKEFDRSVWVFLLLSPTLFIYSRMLWDNPFLIGLTSLMIGCYLEYLETDKMKFFLVSVLAASYAVLTHLMVAPLCIAVAIHFLIFRHKSFLKRPIAYSSIVALAVAILFSYAKYVFINRLSGGLHQSTNEAIFFPFTGLKFYSFIDFEYFYGKQWERLFFDSEFMYKLIRGTKFFWFLFYVVTIFGLKEIVQHLMRRKTDDIKFHISFLTISVLVLHLILCYTSNLYKNPHYFNGVWIIHFFIMAFGISFLLKKFDKFKYIHSLYLGVMATMLLGMIYLNKDHQGARSRRYGANLNQQVKVAMELNKHSQIDEIHYKTFHLDLFSLAIDVLRRLEPAASVEVENETKVKATVDYIYERHPFQKNGLSHLGVRVVPVE